MRRIFVQDGQGYLLVVPTAAWCEVIARRKKRGSYNIKTHGRWHLPGEKVLVVTNTTVAPLYLDKVINALTHENSNIIVETLIFPDGEEHKNQLGGGEIGSWEVYIDDRIRQMSVLMVYRRRVGKDNKKPPSGVMGFSEISVDLPIGGKNFVHVTSKGYVHESSYQPQCVLIDTDTLNTLPNRELTSGIAEVVKYGIIKDAKNFEWQEKNVSALLARDPSAMPYAIKRSCEIKTEIVSLEKEDGLKGTLNLGHTFSHALEVGLGAGLWLHREAVAVGMLMAVNVSYHLGWISKSTVERIFNILRSAKLPTTLPPNKMTGDVHFLHGCPLRNCVSTVDYDRKALDDALHGFCTSQY
ncbi:hypothetical protein IFM89_032468 [Coptis chinensis]|uniref:3-dehydroquinate synthase C-terminal domain-containing protein n=1 Tax=Coptis chinensis TaxID=261450 RepID=A0A835LX35_9MAGN|nr:hypothetical protein IFM89_032468 [Coptis chinensis]